ncbi:MAG: sensor histidine kinase, partial [Desulfomonilaceae bacterium]
NVDRMFESANQQLAFINSLLELMRLDSGLTQLRLSPTDLNLAVNQSVQTMKTFAIAKNLAIETNLQPHLPKVPGDIGQVTRILNNLLSNAVKFTNRGGKIQIDSHEISKKGIGGVEIVITDDGIGITEQSRTRLFSPFNRGREKGTDGEVGSGLGLSICKELMELHNGTIELESSPGKGSVFKLWFPLPQS